jgi:hypothetical protein
VNELTFVPDGWTRADELGVHDGRPLRALHYPSGSIRIEHACKVLGAGDEQHRIVCAPGLQLGAGHTVEQLEPLTVRPSVACGDCGLHGFITDGQWRDA